MTDQLRDILLKSKDGNTYTLTKEEELIILKEYLKEKTNRDVPISPIIDDTYRLEIYNYMVQKAFKYYLAKLADERKESHSV